MDCLAQRNPETSKYAFQIILDSIKAGGRHVVGKQQTTAIERDNSNILMILPVLLIALRLSLSPKKWLIILLSFGKFSKPLTFFLYYRKLSYLFLNKNSQYAKYKVQKGDTLWDLSEKCLGNGNTYNEKQ